MLAWSKGSATAVAWSATVAYAVLDVVYAAARPTWRTSRRRTWRRLATRAPGRLAQQGEKGAPGATGPRGPAGPAGALRPRPARIGPVDIVDADADELADAHAGVEDQPPPSQAGSPAASRTLMKRSRWLQVLARVQRGSGRTDRRSCHTVGWQRKLGAVFDDDGDPDVKSHGSTRLVPDGRAPLSAGR